MVIHLIIPSVKKKNCYFYNYLFLQIEKVMVFLLCQHLLIPRVNVIITQMEKQQIQVWVVQHLFKKMFDYMLEINMLKWVLMRQLVLRATQRVGQYVIPHSVLTLSTFLSIGNTFCSINRFCCGFFYSAPNRV